MDKEITYDSSKLSLAELIELRELQRKMRQETGSIEGYSALTVDELIRLEDLHYTMAGLVNPRKAESEWRDLNEDNTTDWPHVYKWQAPAGYVPVTMSRDSGVTAASTSKPVEPAAVAQAAAPVAPAAPATPATAEKPKLPAEGILSAARQLDALMRFGA